MANITNGGVYVANPYFTSYYHNKKLDEKNNVPQVAGSNGNATNAVSPNAAGGVNYHKDMSTATYLDSLNNGSEVDKHYRSEFAKSLGYEGNDSPEEVKAIADYLNRPKSNASSVVSTEGDTGSAVDGAYNALLGAYVAQQNAQQNALASQLQDQRGWYEAQLRAQQAAQEAAVRNAYNNNMAALQEAYNNRVAGIGSNYDATKGHLENSYTAAIKNLEDYYNSSKTQLAGQYDSQMNKLTDSYNASTGELNTNAERALQEAYISRMLQEKALRQQLSSSGLNGGASESIMASLLNNYGNSRNNIEREKAEDLATLLRDYNAQKADASDNYNQVLADLLNTYNANRQNVSDNYNQNLVNALTAYNNAMASANDNLMAYRMQLENDLANNVIGTYGNLYNGLSNSNSNYNSIMASLIENQNNTYDSLLGSYYQQLIDDAKGTNATGDDAVRLQVKEWADKGYSPDVIAEELSTQYSAPYIAEIMGQAGIDVVGAAPMQNTSINDSPEYGRPTEIEGYGKVTSTGATFESDTGESVDIMQTPDGSLWYWDSTTNKYVKTEVVNGGDTGQSSSGMRR